MLTVFLKILSILGILLLVLLGIALLLILIVLFFPITYKLKAYRRPLKARQGEEGTEQPGFQTNVRLKINWLFGLLRVRFFYPEPGKLTAKLLWFDLMKSGDKDKTESSDDKPEPSSEDGEKAKEKPPEKAQEDEETQTPPEAAEKKKSLVDKIKCTIGQICDKIKQIRENIDHYRELLLNEDTRGLVSHVFQRLGRILKALRPRKLKADVLFGTGSPDTTGYLLGVYSMLSPHICRSVNITPDFEQAVLEGEIYASGHIMIVQLLGHAIMLFLDKRLRQLIRKLKAKR